MKLNKKEYVFIRLIYYLKASIINHCVRSELTTQEHLSDIISR